MIEIKKRLLFGGEVIYRSKSLDSVAEAIAAIMSTTSANLTRANLTGADLYEANLYGANLTRADLYGANLTRATMSWSSHSLISEALRISADGSIDKLKIAGLLLVERDWCWDDFCALDEPAEIRDWAFLTLSKWAWVEDVYVPCQLATWMTQNNIDRPTRPTVEEVQS